MYVYYNSEVEMKPITGRGQTILKDCGVLSQATMPAKSVRVETNVGCNSYHVHRS